jgi:hypothetical protein
MARSAVFWCDGARLRRPSPTLAQGCAVDPAADVKAQRLQPLAACYRNFAAPSGNPATWVSRRFTAEELEAEADRIEFKKE